MRKKQNEYECRKRVREEAKERKIARFLEKSRKAKEIKEKNHRISTQKGYRKQNQKRKLQYEKERWKKGDVRNLYNVILVKNKRKYRALCARPWKTDAYAYFSQKIEENKVDFPVRYEKDKKNKVLPVKYELLLVEHIDPLTEDTSSILRNEYGKLVEHTVVGRDVQIIDKKDFEIEETFYVYGYHPIKDRKTFKFILDEILLKVYDEFVIKRVYTYSNKVIIKTDKSLDIIVCKNVEDSRRLYNELLKRTAGKHYIFFNYTPLDWNAPIMDEVRELTGWNKIMLNKGNW